MPAARAPEWATQAVYFLYVLSGWTEKEVADLIGMQQSHLSEIVSEMRRGLNEALAEGSPDPEASRRRLEELLRGRFLRRGTTDEAQASPPDAG